MSPIRAIEEPSTEPTKEEKQVIEIETLKAKFEEVSKQKIDTENKLNQQIFDLKYDLNNPNLELKDLDNKTH